MPKNDKQAGTSKRAEQVRSAVEGAFSAAGAQIGRDRALDLADELASAAQRVREALEELRPPTADDLKRIGTRLAAIERRLGALEGAKAMTAPAKSAVRTRSAAKPKPAARAAAKPKAAAKRKPATRAAAKPKAAAAKPKPAARRKPAS